MKVIVMNDLKQTEYENVIQVSLVTDNGFPEVNMDPAKIISILTKDSKLSRFQLNTATVTIIEETK